MITIDDRIGSGDLVRYLPKRLVEVARLEYGDVMWLGKGPGGLTPVAVEIKTIGDLLNCINTGRFSGHQLPGLVRDYQWIYLLIEGAWRPGSGGVLETPSGHGHWATAQYGRRAWTYAEVDGWITTMEIKAGIRTRRTHGRTETAQVILDLYRWWTSKEWSEHRAHLEPDMGRDGAILIKPSLVRRVAKELPGIGWEKAGRVAGRFGSVLEMVMASGDEWIGIEGIGKGIAAKVVDALQGHK